MFDWMLESRLFVLARQAQRLPHIIVVIVLGFVFAFVSRFGAIPVVVAQVLLYGISGNALAMPENTTSIVSGGWMALTLISSFILIFVFVWLWSRFYEKRSFSSLGFEARGAMLKYGRGLIFGALIFAGSVGLMALFGFVDVEQAASPMVGFAAIGGVLVVFLGWIVQGAAEEVLTRGWMMPVLGARYKPWIGILVSSLFFAILHGLNPNLSVIALVNLALFGLFAAFYALREGSLWGICAIHSVWNWVQGNFFGFQVSGTNPEGGSLLKLVEAGPDWFTGGLFGPEGGLAVTVVLVLAIVFVFAWPFEKEDSLSQGENLPVQEIEGQP